MNAFPNPSFNAATSEINYPFSLERLQRPEQMQKRLNDFVKKILVSSSSKDEICTYTSDDELPVNLSAEDIADYLGVCRATAYNLLKENETLYVQIGKRKVVPKDKFLAWWEEKKTQSDPRKSKNGMGGKNGKEKKR